MSYNYWNNIEIEKTKAYWIEDESDLKLVYFIQSETNLQRCFQDAVAFSMQFDGGGCGRILDVGAGVAWTSALVSQIPSVQQVIATDYSRHRLLRIAPIVFKQLNGNRLKFDTLLGNFLDIKFEDRYFDVIIFCQSLYMFKDLRVVMEKVRSLLVPDGILIVACERITRSYTIFSPKFYLRKLRHMIRGRADTSGKHYYIDSEYKDAIVKSGLEYHFQLLGYPVFFGRNLMAGNHFGVKV